HTPKAPGLRAGQPGCVASRGCGLERFQRSEIGPEHNLVTPDRARTIFLLRTLARRMMVEWAALVAEHGPRVWRTAFRILNHHADAHDCYQDAFLAAWQITPRDPADWRRILVCLATRKAIDRLRARVRSARTKPLDAAPEPATEDDPAQ